MSQSSARSFAQSSGQCSSQCLAQSFASSDFDGYERACEQAIAMCNGNPLSTIKALILANEYLETELRQWRRGGRDHRASASLLRTDGDAAGANDA